MPAGTADRAMSAASAPPNDKERAATLDAMLRLLDLTIAEAWRATALANMKVIDEQARLVLEFPLEDEDEPAPIFTP